jgi:hypothetical protein
MAHLMTRRHDPSDPVAEREDGHTPVSEDPTPVSTAPRATVQPSLILGGFVALLLAAWAGVAPFVGPIFGFSPDGTASWTWNEVHALGAVAPGAVGVIASFAVATTMARRPAGLASAGFAVFLCGAWLASVPVVWPVLVGPYFQTASPHLTLADWMGLAIGPGVLLASFGAFTMGRARCARSA